MFTITLTIAVALILARLASWATFRTAAKRIETAVLATSQTVTTQLLTIEPADRAPNGPGQGRTRNGLSHDDEETAHHTAVQYAYQLLGRWNCAALRIALLRWNLSPWLDAQIESTIYRLKSVGMLPVSQKLMTLHSPLLAYGGSLIRDLATLYTKHVAGSRPAASCVWPVSRETWGQPMNNESERPSPTAVTP